MNKKIMVYSKDNCVQCKMTKKELERNGIDYDEINLDHVDNPDLWRKYLRDLGYLQSPVVETESETWTGFRPDKIKDLVKND